MDIDTSYDFLQNYQLEGNTLKVFTYPSPILKKIAEPVTKFNDDLRTLVKNMFFTMYNAPGIGLAAPQVGVSLRLFIMDIDFNRKEITNANGETEWRYSEFNPQVFINPIFKNKKGEQIYEEGCLSLPGIFENVKRAGEITVDFQDMWGNHQSLEAQGLLAVCLQHENDHLDGIVFLDRLSILKKSLLMKKFLKSKK